MPVDQEQFIEYLKNPIAFPEAFKDYISDYYATNIPKLHVSQVFGFKLHSIHTADDVVGSEATASTAYSDLATVGPTLEGLANGFYVVMWGCAAAVNSPNTAAMGVAADGDTPSGQREMIASSYGSVEAMGRLALVDFSAGDHQHTLQAKYKSNPTGYSFSHRWLHALRVTTDE